MPKICKSCGAMNGNQATICSRCHKPLQNTGAPQQRQTPPTQGYTTRQTPPTQANTTRQTPPKQQKNTRQTRHRRNLQRGRRRLQHLYHRYHRYRIDRRSMNNMKKKAITPQKKELALSSRRLFW